MVGEKDGGKGDGVYKIKSERTNERKRDKVREREKEYL